MTDREKTISHLNAYIDCFGNRHKTCDPNCVLYGHGDCRKYTIEYIANAVDLLKEQEAIVLDSDQLERWIESVWFEDKEERECYPALIANMDKYDVTFVNVKPGHHHEQDFLLELYKKEWRCWSAKPTEKQKQAVKWE